MRFTYNEKAITATVTIITANSLKAKIECGNQQGKLCTFEIIEMMDCTEVFCSSLLKNILSEVRESSWKKADKTKVPRPVSYMPEFMVPEDEKYKRR